MLRFAPIDLELRSRAAVAIRADSFEVSFGSSDEFFQEYGVTGECYLNHLRSRMANQPGSCVHAWKGDELVGQIELRDGRETPQEGYVNLYYLMPEFRGDGLGRELDDHAMRWFCESGMTSAAPGVSRTNEWALRFYEKNGWRNCGVHHKNPNSFLMRKSPIRPSR